MSKIFEKIELQYKECMKKKVRLKRKLVNAYEKHLGKKYFDISNDTEEPMAYIDRCNKVILALKKKNPEKYKKLKILTYD